MAGELPTSIESQDISYEQGLSNIESQFGDLNFDEFRELFLLQDQDTQNTLIRIFSDNSENNDFFDYIDYEELPYDDDSINILIEEFPLQESSEVGADEDSLVDLHLTAEEDEQEAKEDEQEAKEDEQEAREDERILLSERQRLSNLANFLSNQLGVSIPEEFQEAKQYIEKNYEDLLRRAQEQSDEVFIEVYQRLNSVSQSGIISIDLSAFTEDYNRLQIDDTPGIGPRREADIVAALGDSTVTDIDGDIIRGENGEVLDMSGTDMILSLEGDDGLSLEVGSIERLDTRSEEVELGAIQAEIADNERQIALNDERIESIQISQQRYQSLDVAQYDNEGVREAIAQQFIQLPHGREIFTAAENNTSGEVLKDMIFSFFTEQVSEIKVKSEGLIQRNTELSQQAGVLASRIASQRRNAADRMRKSKEQVRQSQQFLESIGISRVIANAREVFPMISEQNPVYLANGDIVTSINFSTLSFTGSFSPALGEGGAEDLRTQQVLIQLINIVLSGTENYPIELTGNGNIVYRMDGEIVDKSRFDSYVAEVSGLTSFQISAQDNLFSAQDQN